MLLNKETNQVLWSICLSNPCPFKDGSQVSCKMLILLTRFLLLNLVSRSSLVLLRYPLLIFSLHLRWFDCVCFQFSFSFSPCVQMLSWVGSSIPCAVRMGHISVPNSIPISWLYILTVCISITLNIIHTHKVINHFLWVCKFVQFPSCVKIISIINSSGESGSH